MFPVDIRLGRDGSARMRTTFMGAGLLALMGLVGTAAAQGPSVHAPGTETGSHPPPPPVTVYRSYRDEATSSMTQRLIYERAAYRARQRQARLESQKWLGISSGRPAVSLDIFATEQNPVYVGYSGNGFGPAKRSPWSR